ncbi:MAG: DUF2829 domain-containing protein [Companilactobacillus sp.]|jgi:hypothetical protein|uniref:Thoeris anti-defense Tad2 family protein n=1 Tax=Companilactobacillus sp. TaxID=2767905 RepID=UPI0025B85675|nr:MW1434 family type I TA system toxin [Companilactobacillus sp.]MCH4010336.1 DUF2829 domain-containing protein [Companilactobacillus sp.]MCH4051988.1 DUF2829 domain-containing protein [Companilactobacillus sp.]MCH4075776.1 DUF2829 domain-containing protein [Companilactobacillus sp.]MCH4126854.1 DUF2829 domain-containing protein [Companilactobacillus sp.]
MKIQEAIIEAKDKQKGISRKKWMPGPQMIMVPTNTSACFIIVPKDNMKQLGKRWNPTAEDILAHDWMVMG